jgi:hypothetical protein
MLLQRRNIVTADYTDDADGGGLSLNPVAALVSDLVLCGAS